MKLSAFIARCADAIARHGDREVEFSIDISNGDEGSSRRAMGRPTGEVMSTPSALVLLAEGRVNAEAKDLFHAAEVLRSHAAAHLLTNPHENRRVLALAERLRSMAGA